MQIHQIQMRYDELQDRILLRMSTTDGCEFRFWLTRRFVKRLWPLLVRMLEWDHVVRQQLEPEARRAVLELRHEGYAQQADFSRRFEEGERRLPFGEAPVLLARASGRKRDGALQVLSLQPQQGQGIDVTLDTRLLHVISRLLREAVRRADWDVELALHAGAPLAAPPAQPRSLN